MTPLMQTMRTLGLVFAAIIVMAGIGIAGYLVGRSSGGSHAPQAITPAVQDEPDQPGRPQFYTCSMHPQVRTTNPKDKCPICGMDLIPVPTDEDSDEAGPANALRLSRRAAAMMGVQVLPVRRGQAERAVRLFGRLFEDERRLKTIAAWAPGRLERLHIEFTGQPVTSGAPMAELYSPMLIAAQEELLQAGEAESALRDAGGLAARSARAGLIAARDKLRLLGMPPDFIDEVETTGEIRDRIVVPAPLDGIVTARLVSQGDYVETGQPLFRITDLSSLWVQLNVFESDLMWLRLGQNATFTTPSYPGETFEGTVSFIEPTLDDQTRSVRVRIDLPNPDGRLRPGMFARGIVHASLDTSGTPVPPGEAPVEQPLLIPESAPLITGRRAVVYVQDAAADRPTFEPRDVELGPRAGDQFVVLSGLAEGDLVVVHGAFRIDSELQIRGRPSMMQPGGGPPPVHDHGGGGASSSRPTSSPVVDRTAVETPSGFAHQVAGLLDLYLGVTDALSKDDPDAASQAAGHFHEQLAAIDAAPLSDAARAAWEPTASAPLALLDQMRNDRDIDSLRRRLPELTEMMLTLLHRFAAEHAGRVYRAHCPMAFDNRGADWLQRDERIANPYFGASMLRCGTTTVELPAAGGGRP